jgi:putative ABC transport system permease protein
MRNYTKQFFRSLQKRKAISLITIGGNAISMAVLFILVSFIVSEKSINQGFENRDTIYRIKRTTVQPNNPKVKTPGKNKTPNKTDAMVPQTLVQDVLSKVPGVEKMGLYCINSAMYEFKGQKSPAIFVAANDDFLDIFSFRFLRKMQNTTLSLKNNLILTKSFSEKLYGHENPVGEFLTISDMNYTIVGVVNDPPKNSSFRFDALLSIEGVPFISSIGYNKEQHNMLYSFLLLNRKADPDLVNRKISGLLQHWQAFKNDVLSLQPFKEVYFDSITRDDLSHANVRLIYLLTCIAVVIFCMSIINYINLTISIGYEKMEEIVIKRTNGATRKDVFIQFMTESILAGLLAILIALPLTTVLSTFMTEILGKETGIINFLDQPRIAATGITILILTGLLSGIYPAFILSKAPPIKILSGSLEKGKNRTGIIAFQFAVTIVLLVSVLFINKQMQFIKTSNLGFNQELLIKLDLNGYSAKRWKTIKDKLLTYPSITNVTASYGTPFGIYGSCSGPDKYNKTKKIENTQVLGVDDDFIETFGLTILKGRNINSSDQNVCLINEHLYKFLEWNDYTGKTLFGSIVIGVVKNFNYQNLYNEMGHLQLKKLANPTALSIKIDNEISRNIEYIKKTFREFEPVAPITYRFYDNWVQSVYEKEEKQLSAIKFFTVLSIIISCLGLFGLTKLAASKRTKEIGIRKINGAMISEIMIMLNKDIIKWVILAFVIACPIGWYAMHKWLENFAYKTDMSWWVFALSGLMAIIIALLTLSWQSLKVATRNPVEALRYE